MGKIVSIGGVTPPLTLDLIDEEIIKLTKKKHPKILYIPAAGGDDIRYCEFFKKIYEGKFGCKVDVLFLVRETPTESEIQEKVFSSDIIYIEGGSVSRLMEYLRKFNMGKILKEANEKGIVLAGKSAGALCFGQCYFESQNTEDFKIDGFNDYIQVDCLKILELIICPHYNLDGTSESLDTMINAYNIVGIALDNDCAIEFVDDSYRIISTNDSANAYKVYKDGTKIHKEAILKSSSFRDINELMSMS
ncbi:peptidase E [Clostridium sp. CS001]|uniref:Type 1 glutamine amidotransferase-like domain-containing protein n=1 Tax=Clostridium sp. CS001 TaxID=2880648 RepID=UPI001CF55F14|nr:Type 1 glutamine amidotransferase-like domain-containing protein [Clostridium sp. CS001]MCB2291523.1 peptidase E [Clostridium sp. CS001]